MTADRNVNDLHTSGSIVVNSLRSDSRGVRSVVNLLRYQSTISLKKPLTGASFLELFAPLEAGVS